MIDPSHITTEQAVAWFGGVAAAISIKFASSVDDVVWLAPFLTANSSLKQRSRNVVIYVSVCLVQTLVAMLIASFGSAAITYLTAGNKDVWSTEKILTVAAGTMLMIYSVKLSYEWYKGEDDDDETPSSPHGATGEPKYEKVAPQEQAPPSAKETEGGVEVQARNVSRSSHDVEKGRQGSKGDVPEGTRSGSKQSIGSDGNPRSQPDFPFRSASRRRSSSGNLDKLETTKEEDRSQALFVIAFIGSVDDLTLFVPMLVGKGFDIVQLMVGGFIAAMTIVTFCVFIGQCKPIADCLAKIPLALIVIVFGVFLLTKAFFME